MNSVLITKPGASSRGQVCVAAVHGASRDAIEHAASVVETEINSVTDNPILFDDGDVISGGNFHGQSLVDQM